VIVRLSRSVSSEPDEYGLLVQDEAVVGVQHDSQALVSVSEPARTTSTMIGLARGCGLAPFVRVAGTAPRDVQVPLDAGAAGLFVPQIDDAARARDAVRATRFPPLGRRGASNSGRVGRCGLEALGDYLRTGNDEVRLVVQAESAGALEAIVEIGEVVGVDAVFIGPTERAKDQGLTRPGREEISCTPARIHTAIYISCRWPPVRRNLTVHS